ncbi:hypothetical protein SDC9_138618 [bioreactor metagenome]|uniref:Uncharacterized protein n=1 Tax=bioreactor metagenome TaxID=1076179 RepID=A0A645DQ86_9ZZZZ
MLTEQVKSKRKKALLNIVRKIQLKYTSLDYQMCSVNGVDLIITQ